MNLKQISLFLVFTLILVGSYFYHSGIEPDFLIKKYATPESKFIEIDRQKVHYRDTGKGEVLVLLHGVSSSLQTWDGWHKELSNDFRVISLDLPAFGITGPFLNEDYSPEHYMLFLEKFLDKLKIEKCYFAGNSFGGNLTWRFAHKNPNRIIKAAVIDASGFTPNQESLGFALSTLPVFSIISHYFTPRFLVEKSIKNFYGNPKKVSDSLVSIYYNHLLRKGNRRAFSQLLNTFSAISNKKGNALPKILSEIRPPILILWGEKDPRYFPEVAKKFHQYIPNSSLIVYPNVGHMPMEEIPTETANDFRNFAISNN